MTDSEALARVVAMAKDYVHGGAVKGWTNLEAKTEAMSAVKTIEKMWVTVIEAEAAPDGVSDLALKVLEEQGFEVLGLIKKGEPKYFERMLVLSTSHVTEDTDNWLKEQSELCKSGFGASLNVNAFYSGGDNVGWLIAVSIYNKPNPDVPKELQNLLKMADQCKNMWLMLDRDAEVHPQLPTWDW